MKPLNSLLKIPKTFAMTTAEHRANVEGINIVFGAVMGFVLAGAEALDTLQFMALLFMSAGVVVMILYLASSAYKLFYGVLAIAAVALLPWLFEELAEMPVIPKLQPTLAAWTAMVILIELMPRVQDDAEVT